MESFYPGVLTIPAAAPHVVVGGALPEGLGVFPELGDGGQRRRGEKEVLRVFRVFDDLGHG